MMIHKKPFLSARVNAAGTVSGILLELETNGRTAGRPEEFAAPLCGGAVCYLVFLSEFGDWESLQIGNALTPDSFLIGDYVEAKTVAHAHESGSTGG